jgi:hypothetical protein
LSRRLKKFYKTKEGKKLLKDNLKEIEEEQRTGTGWFSKEEDEYWEEFNLEKKLKGDNKND